MIERMMIVAMFPFYVSMRVLGVVVHDVLELREELRAPL